MFCYSSLCLILLFPASVCLGQLHVQDKTNTPNTDPNAPVMNFDAKEHDFGTMDQDANGTYLFTFTNTGKEPLIIKEARGSCGCTVPQWPHHPVEPGKRDTIKVTYDTHRIGIFSKSVTIMSNSKESPDMLFIKGKINNKPVVPAFPGNEDGSAPYSNTQDN